MAKKITLSYSYSKNIEAQKAQNLKTNQSLDSRTLNLDMYSLYLKDVQIDEKLRAPLLEQNEIVLIKKERIIYLIGKKIVSLKNSRPNF